MNRTRMKIEIYVEIDGDMHITCTAPGTQRCKWIIITSIWWT